MNFPGRIIIILSAVAVIGCAGKLVKDKLALPLEDYRKLPWDKKILYFESFKGDNQKIPDKEIYNSAFRETVPAVVVSALKSIPNARTMEFKTELYLLTKHKNPVVRWKSCQKISALPVPEDMPFINYLFSDKDWMVRECAFNVVRLYPEEGKKKFYFFIIISHLDDKNPQVLKEIYHTLKWYNDERTFSFMYKRLFHAESPSELIIIMREIAEYKNDMVKQRIWYLSKNHHDFFVREEATKLLKSMK